jgi:DME family drug/metabolite transporter
MPPRPPTAGLGGASMTDLERGGGRATGILLMLLAALFFSSGGLITRQIEVANGWQVMFYRAVGMTAVLLVVLAVKERGRVVGPFRAIGWGGLLVGFVIAVSMTAYVFAMMLTTVASAQFIISSAPVYAALMSWIVLKERVHGSTWIAIGVAIVGMGIMFADGFAIGRLAGLIVALLAGVTYAILIVILRRLRAIDMLPALIVAGLMAGSWSGLIAGDLAIPANDILFGLLMGAVQTATGFSLIMLATRRLPAAEASLVLLVEPILGPTWVWILLAETPTRMALIGGVIVLGAVVLQTIASVAAERRAASA